MENEHNKSVFVQIRLKFPTLQKRWSIFSRIHPHIKKWPQKKKKKEMISKLKSYFEYNLSYCLIQAYSIFSPSLSFSLSLSVSLSMSLNLSLSHLSSLLPPLPGDLKKVNCNAEISVSRLKRITSEIKGVTHIEKLYKRSLETCTNIIA